MALDPFDFDFSRRFDRQLRDFDRVFEGMNRRFEMDMGRAGRLMEEQQARLPDFRLVNVATTPDHYRYDFQVESVPSGRLLVNSYDDRYSGACFLSLSLQDSKNQDKTYEYTISPDGHVLGQKLLQGPAPAGAIENGPQQQRIEGGSSMPGDSTGSTLAKTDEYGNKKQYVHVSSAGNSMNALSYRLPDDVTIRELDGIKAEHDATNNLLCVLVPRSIGMSSGIGGSRSKTIPVKEV
jgi:hypothetical protein